ncbi:MAG: hypothetical protein HY720_22620 [Planctomycetes bacterium]|nr:hypothetical protein [Planctomycetota bacterium]
MNRTLRMSTIALVLGTILLAGGFAVPAAAQSSNSRDFQNRRRALHERWKNARSPEEKRAILEEFKKLVLEESGPSGLGGGSGLPTPADLNRMTQPLGLSPSLGLGLSLASDGKITDRDVQMLIGLASKDGITDEEKKQLAELRDVFKDTMSPETLARLEETLKTDGGTHYVLNTENKTWTSTYFPMAGSGIDDPGSAESNLWAKDGALNKMDKVFEKRNGRPGTNLERERRPSLNWLAGKDDGFWVPERSVREDDFERTSGVDWNGNGKIDPDVKVDFLDARNNFAIERDRNGRPLKDDKGRLKLKGDGKTDSSLDTGWWGRCNNVGAAGTIFKEPKRPVTIEGKDGPVTFSATEIKGLLALYSDTIVNRGTQGAGNRYDNEPDFLVLKDGTQLRGDIENAGEIDFNRKGMWHATGSQGLEDFMVLDADKLKEAGKPIRFRDMATGEVKEYKPEDVRMIAKEDKEQDMDASVFHNTMTEWLADGRGGVLEMDPGSHVWNYNFESADVRETKERPLWAPENRDQLRGYKGPPGDGEIRYVEANMKYNGGSGSKSYRYWLEEKDGKIVNSGWADRNPDFMWRPAQPEIDWSQPVPELPDLDPAVIKELYEKSTADEPATGGSGSGTGN